MAECAAIGRGGDRHRHDPILKIRGICYRHSREVWGGADPIGIVLSGFEEDGNRLPDLLVVEGESLRTIEIPEKTCARLHHCRRYPWTHAHRGRSWAWRIGKDMQIGEGKIGCDSQGISKCGFSFPWKSDHEISSKAEVGNLCKRRFDQLAVHFDRMPTMHGVQDCVVAALQWDMEIGAELFR